MEPGLDIFLTSVKDFCPRLTNVELAQFASKVTLKNLEKKDVFLQAGKVPKAIGFVAKGLVRSFYIDNNGDEITVDFYAEGDYATHYSAFITRTPGSYTIQCLEPTSMVCLSYEHMQWIYQQSADFEKYGRLVAEEILKRQQARIEGFIFQTAEERYLDFIEHHLSLFNRISISHLCSFLGMERQSLTRIRKKLATNSF